MNFIQHAKRTEIICLPPVAGKPTMRTIKKVRKLIEKDPLSAPAPTLAALIYSLESEKVFDIKTLYTLDPSHFDLAMDLLREWRLDRYYIGKSRVFDVALQAVSLGDIGH